ncbi:hypothetical protein, partial [Desulfobacca acetoxidans]
KMKFAKSCQLCIISFTALINKAILGNNPKTEGSRYSAEQTRKTRCPSLAGLADYFLTQLKGEILRPINGSGKNDGIRSSETPLVFAANPT